MNVTRRRFLALLMASGITAVGADGFLLEPHWLRVNRVRLCSGEPSLRLVQFSDLHHHGDDEYADEVVRTINGLDADAVLFTGDIVNLRSRKYLPQALTHIRNLNKPAFGVLGNHDPRDEDSMRQFRVAFEFTGGRFLRNERAEFGETAIYGVDWVRIPKEDGWAGRRILMCHYPRIGDFVGKRPFDLALAGHSHGGQVRIPFYGALILPNLVSHYQAGLYRTTVGNLYVNVGVGIYPIPIRINCRPEITVFEL